MPKHPLMRDQGSKDLTIIGNTPAVGDTMSTIIDQFEPGTTVTTQRFWAHYVVMEYGIASIVGKT